MSFFRFGLGAFVLTLIKPVGIYFSIIACLVFIARLLKNNEKSNKITQNVSCFYVLIFPILAYVSWKIAVNLTPLAGTDKQSGFSTDLISSVFATISTYSYRWEVIASFIKALFTQKVITIGSYVELVVMIVPLFYLISFIEYIKNKKKDNTIIKFNLFWDAHIILLGAFSYALFILFSYITAFSEGEALTLASYERYMGTYVGGMFIGICMLLIAKLSQDNLSAVVQNRFFSSLLNTPVKSSVFSYILAMLFFLLIFRPSLIKVQNSEEAIHNYAQKNIQNYQILLRKMKQISVSDEDKFYVISQGDQEGAYITLNYELLPLRDVIKRWTSIADPYKFSSLDYCSYTLEQWENILLDCEYVAIYKTDDAFMDSYKSLFDDTELIEDNSIWRVDKTDGRVTLFRES